MSKYKPTFEDYKTAGQLFKETNYAITKLHIFVSNKWGKTYIDKICNFWNFDKKFQSLKSKLEDRMFLEHPEESNIDVFYGEDLYLRPMCPRCMSEQFSWILASGNGLMCLDCGKIFYLTEGKQRKNVDKDE